MKYIFQYIFCYFYVLYVKIINSFTPIISKYSFFHKTNNIIKSLSGLLIQHIPYINNNNLDNTPQIQNKPNQNKPKWLLVGYMEHDPKTEALKNKQK